MGHWVFFKECGIFIREQNGENYEDAIKIGVTGDIIFGYLSDFYHT